MTNQYPVPFCNKTTVQLHNNSTKTLLQEETSSSAVAKRPRDASCHRIFC